MVCLVVGGGMMTLKTTLMTLQHNRPVVVFIDCEGGGRDIYLYDKHGPDAVPVKVPQTPLPATWAHSPATWAHSPPRGPTPRHVGLCVTPRATCRRRRGTRREPRGLGTSR